MTEISRQLSPRTEIEFSSVLRDVKPDSMICVSGLASSQVSFPDCTVTDFGLTTAAYVGITRLERADFYVTCRAGTPLAELAADLEAASLRFPFLNQSARGTVGGMVATGQLLNGPDCHNISRWVLALRVATADGKTINTGAVTYKSVAGYDLPKLFCGSFGTLAIILEASLRLYPRSARPYGKDLEPVAPRIPVLRRISAGSQGANAAVVVSQRIKQAFDPQGVFPAISGWNSR